MHLKGTEALSTFADWQAFFAKLDPSDAGAAWLEGAKSGHAFDLPFHTAAIDRTFEIAHLAINANDEQRKAAAGFVENQIEFVRSAFASRPEVLAKFEAAIAKAREYYKRWGTPTHRQYMFDIGLTTAWGAAIKQPKGE